MLLHFALGLLAGSVSSWEIKMNTPMFVLIISSKSEGQNWWTADIMKEVRAGGNYRDWDGQAQEF